MYLNCKVKIPPEADGKISVKTIKGTPYVYYEHGRVYHKDKQYMYREEGSGAAGISFA